MSIQIAVRIPEEEVALLDAAIRNGRFETRAAALRMGLGRLLADEREREIAEEYRRAYADVPEDEIWGRAGAAHLAESVQELGRMTRRRS